MPARVDLCYGADVHPSYARIYAVVEQIPRGRVATYGQIADLAGLPGHARQVGYALHALPPRSRVPWQRVVNAQGRSSLPDDAGVEQLGRLRREGVEVDERGRVDLRRFAWTPRIEVDAPPKRPSRGRDAARRSSSR